jgi:hypothetical protein
MCTPNRGAVVEREELATIIAMSLLMKLIDIPVNDLGIESELKIVREGVMVQSFEKVLVILASNVVDDTKTIKITVARKGGHQNEVCTREPTEIWD